MAQNSQLYFLHELKHYVYTRSLYAKRPWRNNNSYICFMHWNNMFIQTSFPLVSRLEIFTDKLWTIWIIALFVNVVHHELVDGISILFPPRTHLCWLQKNQSFKQLLFFSNICIVGNFIPIIFGVFIIFFGIIYIIHSCILVIDNIIVILISTILIVITSFSTFLSSFLLSVILSSFSLSCIFWSIPLPEQQLCHRSSTLLFSASAVLSDSSILRLMISLYLSCLAFVWPPSQNRVKEN